MSTSTEHDRYLTIEQLSDTIQVPVRTLRDWRLRGKGPQGFRMVGGLRYAWSDVEAWIKSQRSATVR